MNSKVALLFWSVLIAILHCNRASVEILHGPGSKTVVTGPDGSAISSLAPGGVVVIDGQSPLVVGAVIPPLPVGSANVIVGPAGSISTSYTLAGPAVVASVGETTATEENTEDDGSYKGDE